MSCGESSVEYDRSTKRRLSQQHIKYEGLPSEIPELGQPIDEDRNSEQGIDKIELAKVMVGGVTGVTKKANLGASDCDCSDEDQE